MEKWNGLAQMQNITLRPCIFMVFYKNENFEKECFQLEWLIEVRVTVLCIIANIRVAPGETVGWAEGLQGSSVWCDFRCLSDSNRFSCYSTQFILNCGEMKSVKTCVDQISVMDNGPTLYW